MLLTAAITAAGLATSMAQAVYSVNMVGYINLNIPPGYSMIANQLQGASTSIAALFTSPPEGAGVFKLKTSGTGYDTAEFLDGQWGGAAINLAPGEGAWFFNSGNTAYVPTLVGEVVLNSQNPLPNGYSIRSSVVPQQAGLSSVLGFPVAEGDGIFRKKVGASGYDTYEFLDGQWGPSEPEPRVGESFWVFNPGTSKSWNRNFPVGP